MFPFFGLMAGYAIADYTFQATQDNLQAELESQRIADQIAKEKEELDRPYRERIKAEFAEARSQALNSECWKDEVEKTGFIFTIKNQYLKSISVYQNLGYAAYDDCRLYIESKKPLTQHDIEVFAQAFWYLTITDSKVHFSATDFEQAIEIGGYTSKPTPILDIRFFQDLCSVHLA
ncbi:hypothetical protein IKG16_01275 [Candidatus Saccharibacteria bacterium]|nr:hypothetical protein [Candidatus Saccharibacteria bacterium]